MAHDTKHPLSKWSGDIQNVWIIGIAAKRKYALFGIMFLELYMNRVSIGVCVYISDKVSLDMRYSTVALEVETSIYYIYSKEVAEIGLRAPRMATDPFPHVNT